MDYDCSGVGQSMLIADGWNTVSVVDISVETSKQGNNMWVITTEHPESGSVDKTYAVTKKPNCWVFDSFLKACGYKRNAQGIFTGVEVGNCLGMSVQAQNKAESNEFVTRDGETIKEMRNKFILFRAATEKAMI